MDISIIIPIYKRITWIGQCIEKIISQTFTGSFELIIIDDGSPNGKEIESAVNRFADRLTLKYFRKEQAGPATARNFAINKSSGEIICFLDDDSLIESNWLHEIWESFKISDSIGIVSGKTLSFYRKKGLPLLLEKSVYCGKSWATCNIAYRRSIFESVGGFDESFPDASWEDNDLGLRVIWAGYTHFYNEKAVVYHPHEQSLEEYKEKCLRNGRGAAAFSRKYLLKKPLWGIGTPLVMSRRLIYGLFPAVWFKKIDSENYLKFLWSFYSLIGFLQGKKTKNGKN